MMKGRTNSDTRAVTVILIAKKYYGSFVIVQQ